MHGRLKGILIKLTAVMAILVLVPTTVGHTQAARPESPAAPFEGDMPQSSGFGGMLMLSSPAVGDAFQAGGDRLAATQNTDGGWGWPLSGGSAANTVGPISMGLAKAYMQDNDADQRAALLDAGAFLLTKSGNFSPSDGYLAAELDSTLGVTTYTNYVKANFYDLLAAGTYYRSTAPLGPFDTAAFIARIRTSRAGDQANLAAWDLGIGLVGASMVGVDQTNLNLWIAGTEAEVNELDGSQYYDVIGLAGALYGLAYTQADFDPTAGLASQAWNLDGMAQLLASYQLSSGGFTWNSLEQAEGVGNETVQETAYSILALNQVDRGSYLPAIIWASDYLTRSQLGTGGWEDSVGDGENNEITGEALWAVDAGYPMGDVWVCPSGNCNHPDAFYNTVQSGVNNVKAGGTVHVLPGTYVEQVHISKPLSLFAQNSDPTQTVIQAPNTLTACWGTKKPIICVENADASIHGFTVDGAGKGDANYQFVGIGYHNAGGTVQSNAIKDIRNTPLNGVQGGAGFYALNEDSTARIINVLDNTVTGYQKGGIVVNGDSLTGNVDGNTVTGAGATPLVAMNGIQIGFGATGSITNNTISGNAWTGTVGSTNDPLTDPNADGAAGVLLYASTGTVDVSGNTLTGNQFGVAGWDAADVTIHDNTITGLAHTGNAWPVGIVMWGDTVGTTAAITGNTINTHDYGVLIADVTAGGVAPSATASSNTFSNNDIQVASTDGTVNIATALSGNRFDQAVTVDHGGVLLPFIWSHIQDGVDAAFSGNIVHVNAGTYVENVTITKSLELAGAGQANTMLLPALSGPDCGDSGNGNPFCTGASTMILVGANDVHIHDLTLNGNNPALTSAVVLGGQDIDARSGILSNYPSGPFQELDVHDVTVENVYMRGIQTRGTFDFQHNAVSNVQGSGYSIGIFAWYGPGMMKNNTVSYAQDGISANHSKGIQFVNNTVDHSGSGVHTDNAADGGGIADVISGNTITNCNTSWGGYGVDVFVPYLAPTVSNNTITNCKTGLSVWGQGAAVTTSFTNNTVDGGNLTGSIGAHISTDLTEIYDAVFMGASVNFNGNSFTHNATGVLLTGDGSHTLNATFACNSIAGNTKGVDKGSTGTYTNDFSNNWWGAANGPAPVGSGDSVVSGINYIPWSTSTACPDTRVYVAGTLMGTYAIPSGASVTPDYPGLMNGPVEVVGTGNFFTSERALYGPYQTFNEVMGYPDNKLTTKYYFPWYDDASMQTWILVGNPDPDPLHTATVHITIGGAEVPGSPFTIAGGANITPHFPGLMDGPVVVSSNVNVFASERALYGPASSFNEVMGYPDNQLTTKYYFPWYDDASMQTWILVGNPDPNPLHTATVHITIGGAEVPGSPFTIAGGANITPHFPGLMDGPVVVSSDINIFTSERALYGPYHTFNEVMGYPDNQLTTQYYFPWYDGISMQTWILVGNPDPNPAHVATVHIKVHGVEMPGSPFSIAGGANITPRFPGVMDGPVEVTSDINVFASERALSGAAQSFNEVMGYPGNKLSNTYWFPWYDDASMKTWVLIGKP